ncbi:hypothetical protein TrLO_g12639 [Triparma laevis f. longispina]|uniref:Uncharacterized protein n=1 Tax=Triparma laevis f. longispina TaxID=1714387 RepID=A0A9W7FB20_9STRA|nr:hypothetical protein TrLO_g12639 [Triparma laevis f. longispina]
MDLVHQIEQLETVQFAKKIYDLTSYCSDKCLDYYFVFFVLLDQVDSSETRGSETGAFSVGLSALLLPPALISLYLVRDYQAHVRHVDKYIPKLSAKIVANERIDDDFTAPRVIASKAIYKRNTILCSLLSPAFGIIPLLFPNLLLLPENLVDGRIPGLKAVSNAIKSAYAYISFAFGSFPLLVLQLKSEGRLAEESLSWLYMAKMATGLLLASISHGARILATLYNTSMSETGTAFHPPISKKSE